jgi:hypothetical protein
MAFPLFWRESRFCGYRLLRVGRKAVQHDGREQRDHNHGYHRHGENFLGDEMMSEPQSGND